MGYVVNTCIQHTPQNAKQSEIETIGNSIWSNTVLYISAVIMILVTKLSKQSET
jgi:hypothetical protein